MNNEISIEEWHIPITCYENLSRRRKIVWHTSKQKIHNLNEDL